MSGPIHIPNPGPLTTPANEVFEKGKGEVASVLDTNGHFSRFLWFDILHLWLFLAIMVFFFFLSVTETYIKRE